VPTLDLAKLRKNEPSVRASIVSKIEPSLACLTEEILEEDSHEFNITNSTIDESMNKGPSHKIDKAKNSFNA
jgi:hypothetical protein